VPNTPLTRVALAPRRKLSESLNILRILILKKHNNRAMMTSAEVFLWGFAGSVAIEVVTIVQLYYSELISIPERYTRWDFRVLRFLLAVLGGRLAAAHDAQTRILAINIGASAPLILHALGQGIRSVATSATQPVVQPAASSPEPPPEPPSNP
jgi:hypothetical protein